MANYAQRRDALIRTAAEAGEMVGRQKMADLMALALNDPSVMGKDVLGPERIKKVYARLHDLEAELAQAWRRLNGLATAANARNADFVFLIRRNAMNGLRKEITAIGIGRI